MSEHKAHVHGEMYVSHPQKEHAEFIAETMRPFYDGRVQSREGSSMECIRVQAAEWLNKVEDTELEWCTVATAILWLMEHDGQTLSATIDEVLEMSLVLATAATIEKHSRAGLLRYMCTGGVWDKDAKLEIQQTDLGVSLAKDMERRGATLNSTDEDLQRIINEVRAEVTTEATP